MSTRTALTQAYNLVGKRHLANGLGIKYQSMNNWYNQDRMPRTEFSGETMYSKKIQELTDGKVSIKDLLGFVPQPQAWPVGGDNL